MPTHHQPHPESGATQIHVQDVRKSYGRIVALNGVNLSIAPGELFGLLGPNGAGKTTLLSILAGLLAADSGTVLLDRQPITPRERSIRHSIGLAPQDLALYPELTGRENLQFFGRLYGLTGGSLEAAANEILKTVQLNDRANDRVATYSGGMKRRLNLAASVVHRPKILLLDEPTTGVDPQSRVAIFEEVRRLNAEGTTVVYTSHYMEEVQALCSRVGIIDGGKIIRCAPLSELLKLDATRIRFQLDNGTTDSHSRFRQLPGVQAVNGMNSTIELTTNDPLATLPALIATLKEGGNKVEGLELQPPTLERVFLQLTGHALRD